MYNKFLVNPYLIRNSRYKNALNNADTTRINNRYQNMRNFIIPKEEIINEEKKESFNIEPLNRNTLCSLRGQSCISSMKASNYLIIKR